MPKVTKIGTSLGFIIPKDIIETLGLTQGDEVLIETRGSHIEITPVVLRPKLRPAIEQAYQRTRERYASALENLAKGEE